jgi:hypothetical protein
MPIEPEIIAASSDRMSPKMGGVDKGDAGRVGLHEMRRKALAAEDDLVGRGP